MDATLTFNEIPYDWRPGGVFMEVRANYSATGPITFPARALLITQGLSTSGATPVLTGSAVAGVPAPLFRVDQGAALGGAGSICDRMCRAWIANNPYSQVDVVVLPDAPSSTKATFKMGITGTPSGAALLAASIGGQRVTVTLSASDTASTATTKFIAAVNAIPSLAVVASAGAGADAGKVVLTAKNAGAAPNSLDARWNPNPDDVTPAGCVLTADASFAGGVGNPDVTTVLTAIASTWYTDIVMPWTDTTNMSALGAELERRYAANGRMDAHAYAALAGTVGQLATAGVSLNSRFMTRIGYNLGQSPTWEWAAALGAVSMRYLTDDPARQLRGLTLAGIVGPSENARFIESEQDTLLRDGISTFTVRRDGSVALQRVITSYQTSNLGVIDAAWLDIMTPKVCTRIRYDWRSYCQLVYPRNKLADDGSVAAEYDDTIVTPRRLHSAWAGRCKVYEKLGWIENSSETVLTSVFVRAANDRNRVNARQDIRIIGNLVTLAGALDFAAQA